MPKAVGDCRRLESAMHHAVGALLVIADAVGIPVGFLHQFLERLRVTFAEQIARPLPSKDVARRISPGRTVIGLISGKEIEEKGGLIERPGLGTAAAGEDTAEQFPCSLAAQEMLLVGCAFVGISR